MSSGKKALVRAGPARVTDAGPASGPPGPLTEPKRPFECSLAQRPFLAGRRMSARRVKGEEKLLAQCSSSIGSVSRRMFCSKKKKHCVPAVLLRVVIPPCFPRILHQWEAAARTQSQQTSRREQLPNQRGHLCRPRCRRCTQECRPRACRRSFRTERGCTDSGRSRGNTTSHSADKSNG